MISRRGLLGTLASGLAMPAGAAGPLALPTGPTILRIEGAIARRNRATGAEFDLAMLDALPQGRFAGQTPWTRGDVELTGPLFSGVLAAVEAAGTTLRVVALNEYAAQIPRADTIRWPVILATRRNGTPMAVRDKGPVWVIYPMDRDPALRNETIYARSVWQVSHVVVT